MNSQTSSEFSDDPQSPVSEGKPVTMVSASHSTKTGPSCGTRCVVCSDVAPQNTVFRRHYGVICCEACKCFFRRTVQMGRDYKCRFGNNCPVGRTAVNMKQVCQACRFQTCTKAGMKIDSVKKFPRKSKDNDYPKSSNGPGSMTSTRSSRKESSSKIVIKKEKNPSSFREHKRTQPSSTVPSAPNKNNDGKLSDGDFDYDTEFEQFKFSIASPDLSLYHSVLDTAMPKLFSGESLENIHEKSSIPTPEHSDNTEKPSMHDKTTKELTTGSNSLTKQPSPLVTNRIVGPHQLRSTSNNTNSSTILPDASSILMESKPANEPTLIPAIQLVQSGEEKTGRELSSIMQENSKLAKKRGISGEGINWSDMLAKKIRLEEALSNINARQAQVKANLIRLEAGYDNNTNSAVATTIPASIPPPGSSSYSHNMGPSYHSANQDSKGQLMYGAVHDTPHGTPAPSPLPSPCLLNVGAGAPPPMINQAHSYPTSPHPLSAQTLSQPPTPINNASLPTSPTYSNQPTPTSHYPNSAHPYYTHSSQGGSVFFNSQHVSMPLYQPQQILPALVHVPPQVYTPHPSTPKSSQLSSPTVPLPSTPFSAFTFPNSSHGTGPSPSNDGGSQLPSPSVTHDSEGKLSMGVTSEGTDLEHRDMITRRGSISAPPSACPSPLLKSSRTLASDAPEAEVEEVLGSLKLRIRHMFKWAKSEVEDFEDLSPLDQKALLRRTVSELVMLGFARASIPYDGMLFLGSTGKVITGSNANPGVATVAVVTLSKLVVPLKVLNMDSKELKLMQEIILFNPESNGLYNRETVRQFRKRKHIELLEYTEKNSPGRFGELMCLLTPLYEVSLEVTEQLRLEQFVHEGEARIDALLLMSMINHGGGTTDEPIEDVPGN